MHGFGPSNPRRLAFLDALRGLAALYVLAFHLIFLGGAPLPPIGGTLLLTGPAAVNIFFMISAMSLCASSGDADAGPGARRRFWMRRFWRVVPLFYAVTIWQCLRLAGSPFSPSAGAVLANLTLAFGLMPAYYQAIAMAGWTVGVEILFYAVFPWLLKATRRPAGLATAWLASAALAYAAGPVMALLAPLGLAENLGQRYAIDSLLVRLPLFVTGMICFRIYSIAIQGKLLPRALGRVALVLSALGVCAWAGWEARFLVVTQTAPRLAPFASEAATHQLAQCALWGVLILGLAIAPTRLLVNRFSLYFGMVSYSTYLLHCPIILALRPVFARIGGTGLHPGITFFADAAVTLGVVAAAAWLSFRLVEAPGMRVGRYVAMRPDAPVAA